ncbi:MAG TPA: SDR family oxidoreductase, partial [Gemmatimonadaceae bacterium]|nr:SDR family oxidoreductase [Gemmatimonadaceae bacterium]
LERVADVAVREYGAIDTWVNNAGTSIYGRLDEVDMADKRRLFDVNFWGVVNGCRAALPHLQEQGGALINIGSVLSDVAIPLQGIYSASKHAVKAYTDTLRMELEAEGAPVVVTLVKPASIDTPFFQHAKAYTPREPKPAAPVYAPEVVAETILHCCEHPTREINVGGAGVGFRGMRRHAARLADRYMEATQFDGQQYDEPVTADREDNLYEPLADDGGERGGYPGRVMRSSLYTSARLHPALSLAAAAGLGLAAFGALRALRARRPTLEPADELADDLAGATDVDVTGRPSTAFADAPPDAASDLATADRDLDTVPDPLEDAWRPSDGMEDIEHR